MGKKSLENLIKKFEEVKNNPYIDMSADEYNRLALDLYNAGREDLLGEALNLAYDRKITNADVFHNLGFYSHIQH